MIDNEVVLCFEPLTRSHTHDVVSLQPARTRSSYHRAREGSDGYLEVDSGSVQSLIDSGHFTVVDIELEPGDVLLFKQNLIHSGRPNSVDASPSNSSTPQTFMIAALERLPPSGDCVVALERRMRCTAATR